MTKEEIEVGLPLEFNLIRQELPFKDIPYNFPDIYLIKDGDGTTVGIAWLSAGKSYEPLLYRSFFHAESMLVDDFVESVMNAYDVEKMEVARCLIDGDIGAFCWVGYSQAGERISIDHDSLAVVAPRGIISPSFD